MRRERTVQGDEDAVSITTGYIINVGIATLVLSSLLLGMQGTFDNIEETTSNAQAQSVAEKVASEVTQADRLARVFANSEYKDCEEKDCNGTMTFELREEISDSDYSVEITDGWVNVSTDGGVTRREFRVTSDVNGKTVSGGGTVEVEYNVSSGSPEVTVVG
jgi:hypothetical protein